MRESNVPVPAVITSHVSNVSYDDNVINGKITNIIVQSYLWKVIPRDLVSILRRLLQP